MLLAWQRRAPKALLARMLLNLAADAAGGAIPMIGDIWDFLFRAHARNLSLLRARAADGAVRGHWSDTLVVGGALLLFLASLAVPIVGRRLAVARGRSADRWPLARLALTPALSRKRARCALARLALTPALSRKRERGDDSVGEEALGVDGGHAAGAGRGDRLAVDVVGDVAAREHAGDLGRRRARASILM